MGKRPAICFKIWTLKKWGASIFWFGFFFFFFFFFLGMQKPPHTCDYRYGCFIPANWVKHMEKLQDPSVSNLTTSVFIYMDIETKTLWRRYMTRWLYELVTQTSKWIIAINFSKIKKYCSFVNVKTLNQKKGVIWWMWNWFNINRCDWN